MQDYQPNSKRIASNTVFMTIRMLFLMCIAFFTTRVILLTLGEVDYGIYNVVSGLSAMLVFFRSSLSNVTQRCLNVNLAKNDIEGARLIFCQHQSLYIILSIIIIILAETIGLWFLYHKLVIPQERMTAALWIYQFMVISIVITLISIVYDSVIVAHESFKTYAYIGIYEGLAKLGTALLISIISLDKLIMYGFLCLLVSISVRIIYTSVCRKRYTECRFHFYFNRHTIRDTISMIGWNTVATFVWAINHQGIDILLNMFFGPIINAAKGITFQIRGAVDQFTQSFYVTIRPQIVKSYAVKDYDSMSRLFYQSSKIGFFIMWIISLPILLSMNTLLSIWLKDVPEHTGTFAMLTIVFSLINSLNDPIWSLALAVGKLKNYVLISNSVWLLVFPISYILLRLGYPPESVFVVNAVLRAVYVVVTFYIIRRDVPISQRVYLKRVLLPIFYTIIISGVLSYICNILIPASSWKWVLISFLSCGIACATIWFIGLNSQEQKFITTIIQSKISKIHQ